MLRYKVAPLREEHNDPPVERHGNFMEKTSVQGLPSSNSSRGAGVVAQVCSFNRI